MAPGATLALQGGKLQMPELTRVFDHRNGRLISSGGDIVLELLMDIGDTEPAPITVKILAKLSQKVAG
jgi:hypothetical protein